jgi:hypothetical protein
MTEIHCPSDCPYLTSAREHPAAAVTRRQQHDVAFFAERLRGLNRRQSELFVSLNTAALRYEPPDFQALLDEDLAEAAGALAATLETRARGVIYDHRPASRPAERLMTALRPIIVEGGRGGGTAFDREAAVVLRLLAAAVEEARGEDPTNKRAYLQLAARIVGQAATGKKTPGGDQTESRLILP